MPTFRMTLTNEFDDEHRFRSNGVVPAVVVGAPRRELDLEEYMTGSGDFQWFFEPVFNLFGRQISPAGIAAFVGCLVAGLLFSSFLQSGFMRRQLSRLGLDKNFVAK